MTAAHRPFLRVVGHVQQLAGEFPRRADVDHGLAQVGQNIFFERADSAVVAVHDRVCRLLGLTDLGRHLVARSEPGSASAVEQPDIWVAEQAHDPQGVGSPPIALVAVDHHGAPP